MDTYERTYSQLLATTPSSDALFTPSTIDDYAIACALAGVPEAKPAPDTSMDEELALQLHERETNRLLQRVPSRKARRRSKRLRSLLHHLRSTRVSSSAACAVCW